MEKVWYFPQTHLNVNLNLRLDVKFSKLHKDKNLSLFYLIYIGEITLLGNSLIL